MRRVAFLTALAALVGAVLARRRQRERARLDATARRADAALAAAGAAPGPAEAAPARPAPASGFVSVSWTLVSPPGERPELAIRCHQDDMLVLDRVDVQETPTQVFLTAIARREPRGPADPPREQAHTTVALSRPLGERELIATPVDP